MIGTTLKFVAKQLNQVICQRLQIDPTSQKVQLSAIADADGSLAVKDHNVLLVKLINIEPDPLANSSNPITRNPSNGAIQASPLYLNLKVILAAYFKPEQTQEGLDMLSMAISYIQGNNCWTPQNSPGFPDTVSKLMFEMESVDMHQLNHIWGAVGTKYLPSTLYKLRMVVIDDGNIKNVIPTISEIGTKIE